MSVAPHDDGGGGGDVVPAAAAGFIICHHEASHGGGGGGGGHSTLLSLFSWLFDKGAPVTFAEGCERRNDFSKGVACRARHPRVITGNRSGVKIA